jgi:hypothetical protein
VRKAGLDEGCESIVQASGKLLVREAGQAPKVSLVGIGGMASESARELLDCVLSSRHRTGP